MADYKVNKWSTICMNCSHYSVPDTLVGKIVTVKMYSEKIVILFGNDKVAVREHIYARQKGWSIRDYPKFCLNENYRVQVLYLNPVFKYS